MTSPPTQQPTQVPDKCWNILDPASCYVLPIRTGTFGNVAAAPHTRPSTRRHHEIAFVINRLGNASGARTMPLPFDKPHPSRYRPGKRAQALTTSLPAETPATPH